MPQALPEEGPEEEEPSFGLETPCLAGHSVVEVVVLVEEYTAVAAAADSSYSPA